MAESDPRQLHGSDAQAPQSGARSEAEPSEATNRFAGWLRRFWGRSDGGPDPYPGTEALLPTEQALEALEGLVCEGLVRAPGAPACPGVAQRLDAAGPPPRNAFGRPVREEIGSGIRGSVAIATGMALSGLRATAFVGSDELVSAHDDLCAAADRLVPLVLHAANAEGGHGGYHRIADSGLFQVLASSGQEALDLSLLARWLAERALLPGLVVTDAGCIERLRLPDEEAVRAYLGRPDEAIASPTEGQRILFGNERARLLRWFDPARPVGTGEVRGEAEAAKAHLGSRIFFRDHVHDLARQGMQELARLTGRPLSFVTRHQLDDAQLVLVAQGAAVQAARAAADALRCSRGWKVGVVGVTWLRPFPALELAEALAQDRPVAVIEVLDDPLATEAPLLREIEAVLGSGPRLLSATCATPGPDPAQLAALCELLRQSKRPRRVSLDRVAVPEASGFPRRDALVESVANAYPGLREPGLPRTEPIQPDAEGVRCVGLVGMESELPPDAPRLLAEALADEAGPLVRGRVTRPQPGALDARLRAAASDFPDPGPGAPVSVLLVATPTPRELGDPLATVAPAGTVLVASGEAPEQIWAAMPRSWRAAVRERELRVLAVGEALEAGIEALRACLRGEQAALLEREGAREVAWRDLPSADPREREDPELPQVVRRIERVRPTHDSLPRFWGELLQPRQGAAAAGFPDPLTSSGAVPAGASALQPGAAAPGLPVLDPDACSGCGRCWIACPDSALGVSVLGAEALLTGASQLAGTRGSAADALRRAHKHLAGRLGGQLAKAEAGSLDLEACREGWIWLAERLGLSDEERPAHEAAFEATAEVVARLHPVVTGPFFQEPEQQKKGEGELLILAVDPRSCLGCGLCVSSCPEDALRIADSTPERVEALAEEWRLWEGLPDTAGATLARAAEHPEVGRLPSVLLSRHCAQAQVGGAAGEPGSGERLGGRLVTALVEHHAQRHLAELVKTLDEQRSALEQRVQEGLAEGLSATDMDTLAEALSGVAAGSADLSALGERLDALGARARFDRRAVLRMAHLAGELERSRQRLAEGEDGLGRARFGVVVARGSVAEWAARYPRHPYYAPLTLAPTAQGVELARGIAGGLVAEHVALVRRLRRAILEIEAPADRSARLEAIEALAWEDLETEDRAACPPLLLLGDEAALLEQGFELVTRLLASELPVKIVMLDGRGRLEAGAEPALVAMAHRRAFVLAASLAHPAHLAGGLLDALAWPGPALVHLHTPSPARHGFAVDAALERARLAVEGRAHVLFRYDPSAEGQFGLRASLEGNPCLERDWGEANFAEWAAGEGRFAQHFEPLEQDGAPSLAPLLADWLALAEKDRRGKTPAIEVGEQTLAIGDRVARAAAERLAIWSSLKELTGIVSPFTEQIRAALEQEIEAEQRKALEDLQAEHAAAIAGLRSGADQEVLARLTDRLMALAGLSSGSPQRGNGA